MITYKGRELLCRRDREQIESLLSVPIYQLPLPHKDYLVRCVAQHWTNLKKSKTMIQFINGTERLAYRYGAELNV